MVLTLSELASLSAMSLLIVQGCYFAIFYSSRIARLISLLFFILAAYLLVNSNSVFGFPAFSVYLISRFSTLIPGVIWLISYYLFSDEDRVDPVAWVLLAAYFILRSIGRFPGFLDANEVSLSYVVFAAVPLLIMLGFSIHALYLAVRDYYSYLIEIRRFTRVMFVACIAVLVTLVLGNSLIEVIAMLLFPNREFSGGPITNTVTSTYMLILVTAFNLLSFHLKDNLQSLVGKPTGIELLSTFNKKKLAASDLALVEKVNYMMQVEKRYVEAGFTIIKLSKLLGVHEHRLRRVINREMKYRNFNQFLNYFRIEDAAARLTTTNDSVSNIALDAGFASLSSFNKAFKDHYHMTPTSFRMTRFVGDAAS